MKISRHSLLAFTLTLAAGAIHAEECAPRADATVAPESSAAPASTHVFHFSPWADLMRMQAALDRQFNAINAQWLPVMFAPPQAFAFPMPTQVSTLQQTQDGYRIDIPLRDFKAEDVHVRLDGQLLAISAEASSSGTIKAGQQDQQIRGSRSFAETLTLPGPVNSSQLKESFKDGVLTLTVPARKNPTDTM